MWTRDTPMSPEERITVLMGALDRLLGQRQTNVSRGEMGVLGFLSQHGTVSPTDLAESLNVTTARIANTLKALERKGFIQRKINHPRGPALWRGAVRDRRRGRQRPSCRTHRG